MRPDFEAIDQEIVRLIAGGQALTRSDIARHLDKPRSSIGMRVQYLIDQGVLCEEGRHSSSGGRPGTKLSLVRGDQFLLVGELGSRHAHLGIARLDGSIVAREDIGIDVLRGPEPTLHDIADALLALTESHSIPREALAAVSLGIPGPVDPKTRRVKQAARMGGWMGCDIGAVLEHHLSIPCLIENDANLMALGEHRARLGDSGTSITIKAGTAIGTGIIIDGQLYTGATTAAGELSHSRIPNSGGRPCSCGNYGCLSTIASGSAIIAHLQAQGVDVKNSSDVIARVRDGDPITTAQVRDAGSRLGEVLCVVTNVFNPDAIFLTGAYSSIDPFIAAVRSQLYEGCLPLITESLLVDSAQTGPDAGLYGAVEFALDNVRFAR